MTESSTLVDLLRSRARLHPDRVAYVFLQDGEAETARLTYRDLDERARAVAARLQQERAEPGDRALLLFPPGLEFLEAFFGCLYAGVIAVPSYPPRPGREQPRLRSIVEDSRPRFALATAGIAAKAPVFAHAADGEPAFAGLRWIVTEEIPSGLAEGWREPEVSGETLAFLQYTSGSTADPKGVEVSHGNLLFMEDVIRRAFELDEQSVIVGWLPVYHDMGLIGNVLQPLYVGAACVLMSPVAFLRRPRRWLEAISRYRGTTGGGPNFAYDLCVERIPESERAGLDLSSWRVAYNGAEPVRASTLERFAEAFAPYGFRPESFLPCYGLAEATLLVSGTVRPQGPQVVEVEDGGKARELVSCGPVPEGMRVEVVDPVSRERAEPGQEGELWVAAGPGVPRGYWNRPEVNRDVFQARRADGDGPYLRTGDLGFLRSGELYVTGRLKDLIILRGRNHYPQDLELTAERSAPGLATAGGAAFSVEVDGEERLVIVQEVVPRLRPTPEQVEELAGAIRRAVAEGHEVQAWDVVVLRPGALPKTSSGKVQRQLCRRMYLEGTLESYGHSQLAEVAAPAGGGDDLDREALLALAPEDRAEALESWLRGLAARVLRVPAAELRGNRPLIELGLDSLAAIELGHAVESALGVELPVGVVLEGADIQELGEAIRGGGSSPLSQPPPPRGEEATAQPFRDSARAGAPSPAERGRVGEGALSQGQRGLWFLHRLAPNGTAYHLAAAARIHGNISGATLRAAFQTLADRHEALRTTYAAGPDGEPVAIVHPSLPVAFEEHGADASIEDAVFRPFDLQHGPVLRIDLFDRPEGRILALSVHHMAADFWSFGVLVRELGVLLSGGDPGPAPGLSYTDFVRWQERRLAGEEGERLWRYWHDRLQGLPPLDLPLDRPRSAARVDASADRGGCRRAFLSAAVAERLRASAGSSGTTLFAVLLTAYQAWLHRLTGQADLAVGSPLAGRPAGLPGVGGVGGIVGYFINPVVLRSELPGDPTFVELLAQSRSRLLQALQHGDFPLPLLVQRLRPEHQDGHLVQAMLLVHRGQPDAPGLPAFALGEAGGRLSLGPLALESLPLDPRDAQFDLTLNIGEHPDGLALSLVYDAALFDATTSARWLGHFVTLAEGIAAEPAARISDLPLLSAVERQQLALEWNDREAAPVPAFPQVFAERARRHPERTALSFEGLRTTYGELNARASSLASHLRKLGVAPEAPVGVYLDRGPDLVASLLAVMKAGGAYVPLDPSYPVERLTYMLEDAGARLVLTREDRFDLPLPDLRPVFVEQVEDEPENLSLPLEPERLAYVLYTSGSTGRPKGVQISHGALANLLRAMAERPGLGSSDRLLAVTPVSFDISGLELYLPLAVGAELVLVSRETAVDGHRLLAALTESRASVLQATPATWRLLLAAGWEAEATDGLRVWCGGEALPPELAAELARRGGEVWNLYGPTETTIWSAAARVEAGQPVFLGQPVSDTWIHGVDRGLRPVPAGAVGELVIGGSGLARGYRGRPDVTAERFVPDPSAEILGRPGARLYRTGDLARRKATGELEFLGRIDHQVKVRGYRIELGEIEAVMTRHPGVREAVVVAREAHAGERLLAAFWTGEGASGAQLREHLRAHLPEYMVPFSFQLLEALPLTPNGKVDRKALLRLEVVEGAHPAADHEPPRGELEETLAQIWRSVLPPSPAQGAHGPGRQDHFFHLGGHSLLATQVVSRLRTLLGVEVPLRALFEAPTLSAFANRVRRQMRRESGPQGTAGLPPLTAAPELRGQPAPLSFAQQRLWFLDQLERGTAAYNIPAAFRLQGRLDPAALEAAFGEIVRRHDALRTTFQALGEEPVQTVAEPAAFFLPRVDLSGLKSPGGEGERLLESEARRPFDLERGPLFRPVLIRLGAEEHLLSATIHHIVSDGWSGGVLIRELIALYRNRALPELPIQYADFARWQRRWLAAEEALGAELAFWREQLRDLPARLDLPTDRPRVPIQAPRGVRLQTRVGADTARRLRALARAEGATLFMVLLAGFQALLSRLSGQLDLAVGSPVAGRTRVELEGLIGFFVNTLVIRGDLSGDPDVRTLIARLRERTLAAQAHQEVPFERLVEELQPERSLGHTPFFQVMFVFQNTPPEDLTLPGLRTAPVPVDTGTAKFDLLLSLEEDGPGGGLAGWLELNADLFDPPTVRRLLEQLERLLAAAADHPETRIADLPLLPEWERHQVVAEANGRLDVEVPWDTLQEAFERQAARTPDALAVIAGGAGHERLSYRELDRRANALARHLRALGAGPETIVGVGLPRTADLPVTLLAILKAGAAYLPLDPGYPADRIAFMLEDSGARAVVTREGLLTVPSGVREILLDRDAVEIGRQDGAPLDTLTGPGNLAYVIYTSGSTGRPKGVAIEHGSAVRLAAWAGTLHGPDELARVLAATSVNFDLSVYELFVPLAFGGAIVLAADALALSTLPGAHEVTLVNTVPSAIAALLDMGPLPASVRTVNLAGEPLRRALVDRLYAPGAAPGLRRVWNLYGPTEDTTYSTFALARRGEAAEPTIGRPISGSQAYLLDRELRPQPLGVPGELALGGGGLARGYLGRPALTAERFIPDPFGREAGGRLYRTGDLARLRLDGGIEYLGRIDHQVKIRGFRIELGEIESALARQPAVREAAVLALPEADGGRRLVAYVSPRPLRPQPGAGVQEGDAAELVASWGALYDEIYQRSTGRSDPRFDIECWQSSYTGNPLPEDEMREWVDRTVERVLSLKPRRVLEVGCGTGLLLYRVAPHVERYRGTDLSETAVAAIRSQLAGDGLDSLDGVSVACAGADDWSGVQPGEQDLVVLSSVAQYFPGPGYLARFVADAVRAVEPAGAVFLGDLRSLPLREAFHASVEMFHLAGAPGTLPLAELRERVRRRMAGEEELAVDPSFFTVLARSLPAVRRVRILLKRGRHLNELTRYRYDVVLEVGAPTEPVSGPARPLEEPTLPALEARLAAGDEAVLLEDVPNARLAEDRALLARLHGSQGGTLGELRQALAASPGGGLDPEEVWELAGRFGYEAEIGWGATPWTFSAVVHRPGVATASDPGLAAGPLETLTNDPLGSRAARQARARLSPELRRALEAELPDYMVPAAFVVLDELPHTPNGKIDRLALSRIPPRSETREDQVPVAQALPQGPVEEMLAGIWSELLWVESVGRDDNFFDLGGHSLLGTRVVARVREALGVELPLTAVFEAPTLAGLARRVEEKRPGSDLGPIPRVPRARALPLSFAQRRLWFLDRLQPGQAAYNMPLEVRLAGRLEVAALAIALSGIVRRHEGLRAAFVIEGEEPAQVFPAPASVPLPVVDLAGLPSEELAREARRLSQAEARRPFDLTRGPLLRAALLCLGDGDHRLLLTLHHIVADGWSLEVLFRDLAALYAGAPLPELPIQPADYAVWEEAFLSGERLAPQLAYWERQLAGVPVLELPADRPRPAVRTLRGAVREGSLSPERVRDLAALARRERVTPFTVLLAAFQVLLFRYSGQGDLAVGSPVANRGRAELEPLIGLFVNTLVLRTRLTGDLPFRELLSRVRQTVLEAFRNSDLPFERLVEHLNPERSLSHNPLFQTTFAFQQVRSRGVELPGLALEPAGAETGAVKFDLSLSVLDWGEPGGRWGMTLEYSSDLFDGATAERLLRHFEILLAGAAAGAEEPVGRLPLLDEAERFQVLGPWSDGGPAVQESVPAHEQVATWAARTPDAAAVLWEGGALTYGELNARAEGLAAALRDRVKPGNVVGVYAGRSPEMIVALLAVLKAGAAYAPLDPAWPRERVAFAVEDAAMPVLLAHADLVAGLEVGAEVLVLGEWGSRLVEANHGSQGFQPLAGTAYVIYTSGSTGTPKGVAVPHSGLANLIAWHRAAFAVTPADRATQIAGVAFDASVWEIWPYLASGASVHLVSEDVRLAPSRLVRWLAEKQITVAFLPTPLAELALDEPWPAPLALRVLLTGGDRLRRHPPAGLPFALVNCYGPTEGTVVATSGAVESTGTGLPAIGRPISGVRTLVLDRELQPVPPGIPGELFVGGAGLAQGYLRRPDLTAGTFVPDPFSAQPGERLYRTGDLVRFLADTSMTARIEFLRRLDDQVKVKGFRIELGEIEAALGEHPGVRDAVVVARLDSRGETRLVAYGVASQEPPAGELRAFLSRRLPEYMVPAVFLFLDALPLTPNGKVDRAALPAPDWQRPEIQGGYEAPRTPVEEILAAVWAELLGLDPARVGIHDNFFELGGHSLKAGQLVLRVRDTFGVELPVRTVFEAPSVATMAVAIGRKLVEQADPELLAQVLSEMQGA